MGKGPVDRFDNMRVFAKVVESGSFAGAAARISISASMVSQHVKELEERLGARLLNRTTRKVSLTETGRAYYERCTRLLADLEETEQAVSDMHAAPRGELRQMQYAESRRGIDAQLSARSRVHVAYGLLGFLAIGPQPPAALLICAASLGEADLARRAVQQARGQPLLEFLHMLADHARGNAEPRRSAGEAAAFHHLGEDPHIVEAIHRVLRLLSN